jgi:hypothetical protein
VPNQKREVPYSQGVIALIDKWFFRPLIRYKPLHMSLAAFYETILFDYRNRDIARWRVKKRFKMPGLLCLTPIQKIQGSGFRKAKPGDILWVRQDARTPDVIDVEWLCGKGKQEHWYSLSASEWEWVKFHCEEAEKKKRHERR